MSAPMSAADTQKPRTRRNAMSAGLYKIRAILKPVKHAVFLCPRLSDVRNLIGLGATAHGRSAALLQRRSSLKIRPPRGSAFSSRNRPGEGDHNVRSAIDARGGALDSIRDVLARHPTVCGEGWQIGLTAYKDGFSLKIPSERRETPQRFRADAPRYRSPRLARVRKAARTRIFPQSCLC